MQSVIENSRDLRLTLHGVTTVLSCAFKRREEKEGDKVGKEETPDSTWLSFLLLPFVPIPVIFRLVKGKLLFGLNQPGLGG